MMHLTLRAIKSQVQLDFGRNNIPLTTEQFIILKIVDKHDDIIQQELADLLQVNKSAILRHINTLQEEKFLARIADTKDKRRNQIVLTKAGHTLLEKALESHNNTLSGMLGDIDQGEMDVFLSVMQRIRNKSEEQSNC